MECALPAVPQRYVRRRQELLVVMALFVSSVSTVGVVAAEGETALVSDQLGDIVVSDVVLATDSDGLFERASSRETTAIELVQPLSLSFDIDASGETGGHVEQTQALGRATANGSSRRTLETVRRSTPRPQRTAARAGMALGMASIPFMIGDTGAGTCFSLRGIVTADISHPTLTCSRLNISENNTALPVDRFYYSYRHFHNSTGVQVFQYKEDFNFDRHTLGLERTFWGQMGSLEVRVPIEHRLRSDLISLVAPAFNAVDVVTGSDDREVDLGNLSFVTKLLLTERRGFALSAGLGVTVPTARDVDYDISVLDTIIFPIAPGVTGDTFSEFQNHFANETVYLSPFLAWLWAPQADRLSRWYHQGFLQVEVAANPSTLTTVGSGFTDFFFGGGQIGNVVYQTPGLLPTDTDIFAQTLLRVNLGLGYQISDPDPQSWVSNLRTLFEMHYTTTLQRANVSNIAIEQIGVGAFFPQFATAGNADPRTDILNVAAGLSADVGPLVVTNGVSAPIRTGFDRGFDFEYNLQVQLPY